MLSLCSIKWFKNPLFWILLLAGIWRGLAFLSIPLIFTTDGTTHFATAMRLIPFSYDVWFQAWITPAYAVFLRSIMLVGGVHPLPIIFVQSVLGLLSVLVYYKIAERVADRNVAIIIGLYIGLHPGLVVLEHFLLTETLALFLQGCALLLSLIVLHSTPPKESPLWSLAAGLLWAIAALVRPVLLIMFVIVTLWGGGISVMRLFQRNHQSFLLTLRSTALIGFCGLLIMSPWLVNNLVMHRKIGLTGISNIGRLVFALREGFMLPSDSPELLALVPDMPQICKSNPEGCGWDAVQAVRAQGKSEYQIDDWAQDLLNRYTETHPGRFVQSVFRTALEQTGLINGRWHEVDDYVLIFADKPELYISNMKVYVGWDERLGALVQPERFGLARKPVIQSYHLWDWRFPLIPMLFLLGLPWAQRTTGLGLITLVTLAGMLSLTFLLAPVDRYLILLEPLLLLVGLAGCQNLLGGSGSQ